MASIEPNWGDRVAKCGRNMAAVKTLPTIDSGAVSQYKKISGIEAQLERLRDGLELRLLKSTMEQQFHWLFKKP
ncbi:MAG: hypothetical protein K1566_19775 [Candidatus Thiodiazotropha sp. (ex. Lucinisca nassula)]|nr:hypothetical protein [Candidatus Thiodiazotropha sp. (ex. Lucinisca nassula)]MBW9260004.1 hypothetical protein [Candidatus Thiodiazotropha sp. (ex. Lucinisca nassula)]MBW9271885.1 hypothetical protein [Candidatus Thiodiazotropha sp. (ex. Lucinisca nassula)]